MIDQIKQKVNILELIEKDLEVPTKSCGTDTYQIEDENQNGGCPFCSHKGCFKIFHKGDDNSQDGYHCFSCNAHGDVITWVETRNKITTKEAIEKLREDYNIPRPAALSPLQEIFNLAAQYYSKALWENCTDKLSILSDRSPLDYQRQIRSHSDEAIKRFNIGWSDGGLLTFLTAFGYEEELLVESGLISKKADKPAYDFFMKNVFIYPHYVNGRVSHFTFKDPLKRKEYQLPNKYVLNGYEFYNQDSVGKFDSILMVEGENDLISVWSQIHDKYGVIATIGSLSGAQLEWLSKNAKGKNIITVFDPDDAGDKYREKIEKMKTFFAHTVHVMPPEGKDIDELIKAGGNVEQIANAHQVKVEIKSNKPVGTIRFSSPGDLPETPAEVPGTNNVAVDGLEGSTETVTVSIDTLKDRLSVLDKASPSSEEETVTEGEPANVNREKGSVYEENGCYYQIKFIKDEVHYVKISNFVMRLKNVFLTEEGDRVREILVIREDGLTSEPIRVSSEEKVTVKSFKVLLAKACDASFNGGDNELGAIWAYVYARDKEIFVKMVRSSGRIDELKCWVMRNALITDSGKIVAPDEANVFWPNGKTIGIKAETISVNKNDLSDMPEMDCTASEEDTKQLLGEFLHNLARNVGSPGKALTMVGWMKSVAFGNSIFSAVNGNPYLFLHGSPGSGKGTIAGWLQELYGMSSIGRFSVAQIKSGVGLSRKAAYYASLPILIDEIRSNDMTAELTDTFRGYYDRYQRTMGTKETHSVRSVEVKSVFMFAGEDVFTDDATKQRCVLVRIPREDNPIRETKETYEWMKENMDRLSAIGFRWIVQSASADHNDFKKQLRSLTKDLTHKSAASSRKAACWATAGLFGLELADEFFPDFDYAKFLVEACSADSISQKEDAITSRFFQDVESIMSEEGIPKITYNHIMTGGKGDEEHLYIWFKHVYDVVNDKSRNRGGFSKHAVLGAIREEPYYIGEKKVQMGMSGIRQTVLAIDLKKASDVLQNIAQMNVSMG